jgi:hypothetical protein
MSEDKMIKVAMDVSEIDLIPHTISSSLAAKSRNKKSDS